MNKADSKLYNSPISILSGLNGEDEAKQVQALTLCFSRETLTIVQNFGLSEDERKSVSAIIVAIKRYIEGHINESVERRNFQKRTQPPSETFDDFLFSLRELVKTCNFCSETCTQKNLRDQVIEGLLEIDTVETLLQEPNLTLATTINKCQAQEAAKKQRANIANQQPETIAALQRHRNQNSQTCFHCQKVGHFVKVCRSKPSSHNPRPTSAQAPASTATIRYLTISNIRNVTANEPAPLVKVLVTSANGSCELQALLDSGADISAAGKETLQTLNEQVNSLIPSRVIPKAANGMKMYPLGKIPVKIQFGCHEHSEELQIYPNISGTLLSWKLVRV